jgi:hypothetical protein
MSLPPPPAGYVQPSNDIFMARAAAFGLQTGPSPASAAASAHPPLPPPPAGMAMAMAMDDAPPALPSAPAGGGDAGAADASLSAAVGGLSIAADTPPSIAPGPGSAMGFDAPPALPSAPAGYQPIAPNPTAAKVESAMAQGRGQKLPRKPDIDTLPKKPTPAVNLAKDATPHERLTAHGDAAFAAEMGTILQKAVRTASPLRVPRSVCSAEG